MSKIVDIVYVVWYTTGEYDNDRMNFIEFVTGDSERAKNYVYVANKSFKGEHIEYYIEKTVMV